MLSFEESLMKRLIPLITLANIWAVGVVQAAPLVVYGEDDRIEVSRGDAFWQEKARSVAVRVARNEMISSALNHKKLSARTLKEANSSTDETTGFVTTFCEETPFINQPNPGSCTGFLVGPDLLLTAGHCASSEEMCASHDWIFDFQTDQSGKVDLDISNDRIYSCKRIIRAMTPDNYGMDFALIQLNRDVVGRPSLDLNIADHVGKSDKMLMIGSPLGLPLKISPNALVRDDDQVATFSTTLDSFFGNSGSPVFNQRTGKVEGILVAGEEDHVANMAKMCVEINRCKEDECRGEDVSRLSTIPEIAFRETLQTVAREGRIEILDQIESMNIDFFVDIYGGKKITPLMTALDKKQLKVAEKLLSMGANPNHQSLSNVRPVEILIGSYKDKDQFEEALDMLIKAGADIGYRNAQGETLLFAAVRANNHGAVEVLLSKGLDPKAKNREGKYARDIAKTMKLKPIRQALFKAMYGKGLAGMFNSLFKKNQP